jgi:large subunit ribosomal protein L5
MPRIPQLKQRYPEEMVPLMMKEYGFKSPMRVPRLEKIVLNISLGEAIQNPKAVEAATSDLAVIAGQHPVTTKARKSVASFKLREGMTIGAMVTLRGNRMYDFMDRLVNVALPRIRDFHGVPRDSFDGRGNYSLGLKEQIVFPEIDYDKIDKIRGLQVVIVTTARNDEEGRRLLELMGIPFAKG